MECISRVVIIVVIVMVICASVLSVKGLSNYEENKENRVGGISENILEAINYLLTNTSSDKNLNYNGNIAGWLNPTIQSVRIENSDSNGENKIKKAEVSFPANVTTYSAEEELRRNKTSRDIESTIKDEG
jgi:hypothetical protein